MENNSINLEKIAWLRSTIKLFELREINMKIRERISSDIDKFD
jgi:hypothetical protein